MGPATGARARRKQETKDALEAAALALFSERGFEQVTVEDIAAAADVSARTFFRHFGSKDDVLFADNADRLRHLEEELAARPPEESALTAVRQAVLAVAHQYAHDDARLLLRSRLLRETPSLRGRALDLQAEWEHVIARAVAARLGVDDDDLRPRLLGACAVAGLRVVLETWLDQGGKADLPTLVAAAMRLVAGAADPTRWASGEGLRPATPALP
ncbi:MAG TPA: TetR family transcriptional regulator [Acidimicrobiales bacterium]